MLFITQHLTSPCGRQSLLSAKANAHVCKSDTFENTCTCKHRTCRKTVLVIFLIQQKEIAFSKHSKLWSIHTGSYVLMKCSKYPQTVKKMDRALPLYFHCREMKPPYCADDIIWSLCSSKCLVEPWWQDIIYVPQKIILMCYHSESSHQPTSIASLFCA